MKKLIPILLAVILILAHAPSAAAVEAEETAAADRLYALGLFRGVDTNADGSPVYELDRAPNRMEAVTMLIRLLGKETEANAGTWDTPFDDVDDWAVPYVGCAYAYGLTRGTDLGFEGRSPVTAAQYLTFILRALGYSSDSDFRWDAAWELTDALGVTSGEYDAASAFDRGDVAKISLAALGARMKGASFTLGEKLLDEGAFTAEQYAAAMGTDPGEEGQNPVMNFAGDYQCGRASALVECEGTDSARITIRWGGSAWEEAVWVVIGPLDPETLTVAYSGGVKRSCTYGDGGEPVSEVILYEDGTGTVAFHEDGTFTWHEDWSEYGTDMVFERLPAAPPEEERNPVTDFVGVYTAGRPYATVECSGTDSARIEIFWSSSYAEHTEWHIVGRLDPETLTIRYSGCSMTTFVFGENGELLSEATGYENGAGTIVFGGDGSFTWHEEGSSYEEDILFLLVPAEEPEEAPVTAAELAGRYDCQSAGCSALVEVVGDEELQVTVEKTADPSSSVTWAIYGLLDPDTRTLTYTEAVKANFTFTRKGDEQITTKTVAYRDGTGTIVFGRDGSFTWHEDQGEGEDLTFLRTGAD